jgi:hypothetical protein
MNYNALLWIVLCQGLKELVVFQSSGVELHGERPIIENTACCPAKFFTNGSVQLTVYKEANECFPARYLSEMAIGRGGQLSVHWLGDVRIHRQLLLLSLPIDGFNA